MLFKEFWSQATARETDPAGEHVSISCWRGSDSSREDAHQSALAVAQRIAHSLIRGEPLNTYHYGRGPLREEVLQRLTDDQGELFAAVSQNAYGSLVLNTTRAMFIDVDFPPVALGAQLGGLFYRLLGKPTASPEDEANSKVAQFIRNHSGWGARVYRTCAGLRVLVTHALFDPCAAETRGLLESAGADPLYIRLCQAQQCFRARLSPKPWRCGHTANFVQWPREDDAQRTQFEQWQAQYLARQTNYATCRLLAEIGNPMVHPEIKPVVEIHDRLTRCQQPLELA